MSVSLGQGTGPLSGLKIVELAGIGPAPHACMILADLGADVIRVDRPGGQVLGGGSNDLLTRGRPSVALDLKHPDGIATLLALVANADVLVEGMRPGVAERLGCGPGDCRSRNERLVYARMTGWGQDGPLSQTAGHDMNYIAVAGALHGLGQSQQRPHFPSNLLGDFGGGSTYLVIGILAAVLESRKSGSGQVVDAAIVDGTASLNAMSSSFLAGNKSYYQRRASNMLDGGSAFYDLYETADGQHMSVGPLEPQFYDTLVQLLGIGDRAPDRTERFDAARNAELRLLLTEVFLTRTREQWCAVFDGTDACVAPVLSLSEAAGHEHMRARRVFVEHEGIVQPQPAPRFSKTPASLSLPPARTPGAQTREALTAWGIDDVDGLLTKHAVVQTAE